MTNDPPPPPVVTPNFTQIASENDAQYATMVLPESMSELTVQLVNTRAPIWEGDIGSFGQQSSPIYSRYIDVISGGTPQMYLLSSHGQGTFWGRTSGKDCGYHDCQRGYTRNLFSSTGDPAQTVSYPQISTSTTGSLTLYNLPAFSEIRIRTTLIAADKDGRAISTVQTAAQNGGVLDTADNRYGNDLQVQNRSDWRVDYRATGKPGALPANYNRCPSRTVSYGQPPTVSAPQCRVTLPAGVMNDVISRVEQQSERVQCDYIYECAFGHGAPNTQSTWVPRRERQVITPIDTR